MSPASRLSFNCKVRLSLLISDKFLIAQYITVGFCLNQFLWVLSFSSIGRIDVNGLPDWLVPIGIAHLSILPIFMLSNVSLLTFFKKFDYHPLLLLIPFILVEIFSQIFGRSLIKSLFSGLIFFLIISRLSFDKQYDLGTIKTYSFEPIKLIHSEILDFLKISVTVCTFVLGIIGVSFAVNFLKDYYGGAHSQFKMWWYGSMVIYVVLGMFFILITNISRRLIEVRELLINKKKLKNKH